MNCLVIHDGGPFGQVLLERLRETSLTVNTLLLSQPSVVPMERLQEWIPEGTDMIVNGLFETDPEVVEHASEEERRILVDLPRSLVDVALQRKSGLFQLSSVYVFDGRKQDPYIPSNPGNPVCLLGSLQWEAEQYLRSLLPRHLMLRTGWPLARFLTKFKNARDESQPLYLPSTIRGNPVGSQDLARVVVAMLQQLDCGAEVWGTYHYAGQSEVSLYEMGSDILSQLKSDLKGVHLVDESPSWAVLEPENAVLNCQKLRNTFGIKQQAWIESLASEWSLLGSGNPEPIG